MTITLNPHDESGWTSAAVILAFFTGDCVGAETEVGRYRVILGERL